jgi:hypothetical protein
LPLLVVCEVAGLLDGLFLADFSKLNAYIYS